VEEAAEEARLQRVRCAQSRERCTCGNTSSERGGKDGRKDARMYETNAEFFGCLLGAGILQDLPALYRYIYVCRVGLQNNENNKNNQNNNDHSSSSSKNNNNNTDHGNGTNGELCGRTCFGWQAMVVSIFSGILLETCSPVVDRFEH